MDTVTTSLILRVLNYAVSFAKNIQGQLVWEDWLQIFGRRCLCPVWKYSSRIGLDRQMETMKIVARTAENHSEARTE